MAGIMDGFIIFGAGQETLPHLCPPLPALCRLCRSSTSRFSRLSDQHPSSFGMFPSSRAAAMTGSRLRRVNQPEGGFRGGPPPFG